MRRASVIAVVVALTFLGSVGMMSASEAVAAQNGRIAFERADPSACSGCISTYTVNPDGSHEVRLLVGGGQPHWSPNGEEIAVHAGCNEGGNCAAVIVRADTGTTRVLPNPDPSFFNVFFVCLVWSPDGKRLACDTGGEAPSASGIYTIRASDGGGLTPVLTGCDCGVMDYSPDGKRLLINDTDASGQHELFSVKPNGSGLHQITPSGTIVDWEDNAAGWSSIGNHIVFAGHTDAEHRRSIFMVNADGSGLHQVPIADCGGASSDPASTACFNPGWSPDSTKIVFARASSGLNVQAIDTANADGTGASQVTTSTNLGVCCPDWGTHPLAT
jgi:Tol biopolymer transport system component